MTRDRPAIPAADRCGWPGCKSPSDTQVAALRRGLCEAHLERWLSAKPDARAEIVAKITGRKQGGSR